jgi:hypothetical protein
MKINKSKILKDIETYNQLIVIFDNQKDYKAKGRSELNLQKLKIELNGIKTK